MLTDLDKIVETLKVLRPAVVVDLLLQYLREVETQEWHWILDSLLCLSPPEIRDRLRADWLEVSGKGTGGQP
jgi:hypothetical protein